MSILAQGGVVDVIHGVEVSDPYRWLEDRTLPETEEWICGQKKLCERYFLDNKFYVPIKEIASSVLSAEVIDQAAKVGSKVFLRKQLKGHEQATIWMQSDEGTEPRLLFDPAAFGSNISVEILRISSDGSLLALGVRASGSDAMEIHILETDSGVTLSDHLPLSYFRGLAFETHGGGFYYCIEPWRSNEALSIRRHHFGDPLSNDVALLTIPRQEHRRLVLLSSGTALAAIVSEFVGVEMVQDLFVAGEADKLVWNLVYKGIRGRYWPILAHGRVFLLDMQDTPNGSLVDLGRGEGLRRTIIPETPNVIQTCSAISEGFLVGYRVNGQPRFERWSCVGNSIGSLTLPLGGSVEVLQPCSERNTSVFLLHGSYTKAPDLLEVNLSRKRWFEPVSWAVSDEHHCAHFRECRYRSSDGTDIPIILIEPRIRRSLGPKPVILFGYGGFGTAEVPRYSRLANILLELGATIARPSIRGGSEFGDKWHQSATRTNRQVAIDDFLSAAEWLLSEGITDNRHLAIIGASNGGLLVAAAAVQRPNLFRAVVCTGPLTDMIRYERFDYASRWRGEYGTVEDADDFRALLAYSPYHNVKDGIDYPAALFVTGDADDRCNPAHVRKMAAVLQGRRAQRHRILVDYAPRWGHVPTLSLTERIEALSRKIAFLYDQLELATPGGALCGLLDS